MKIHNIDTRVSDADGLFAELSGERCPVPSREVDAQPITVVGGWPCAKRGCKAEALLVLVCHRKYTRQEAREEIGLCAIHFDAHRDGYPLLVGVQVRP